MTLWHVIYKKVQPYVVSIETPEGSGTGFLLAYNERRTIMAFATAAHVIEHAGAWKQPIRVRHHDTGKELFLRDTDRVVEIDRKRDSAVILAARDGDYWPTSVLPILDASKVKKVGIEVGWVGYPAIAHPHLCLFTGRVSAFVPYDDSYLIDGVAINGVSGGPVFATLDGDENAPQIVGTISAYMPNRQGSSTLPGMLQAHDVTTFHEAIGRMRSLDEARQKKEEDERAQRQLENAGEMPPAPTSDTHTEPGTPQS